MADRTCNKCGIVFKYPYYLVRHIANKNGCIPISKSYICNKCNSNFSNKQNLTRHYKICNHNIMLEKLITLTTTVINNQPQNVDNNNLLLKLYEHIKPTNYTNPLTITNNVINNGNIDNSNNINNISNSNNGNNSNNNIIMNSNTTVNIICPPFIHPFGYEDISFITDEEKLNILTSYNGVQMALEKVYSKPQNCNFYRPNSNKDNVMILDKNMEVQVKKQTQFLELLIDNGVQFMERFLYTCKDRIKFADNLNIINNIEENNFNLKSAAISDDMLGFIETCFQNISSKNNFIKFRSALSNNKAFKQEQINKANLIHNELNKFITNGNLKTINDKFLKGEVWSKEEAKEPDADSTAQCNDLSFVHLENTKRYKFFNEMYEQEIDYLNMHGFSLGDIKEYRNIMNARIQSELTRITTDYKNSDINTENRLVKEIADKLINRPKLKMRQNIKKIKFYNNNQIEN